MKELAAHHVGGHLKVAPGAHRSARSRHDEEAVARQLRGLRQRFKEASRRPASRSSTSSPISSPAIPARDLHAMIDLALFLKRNGYRPDQVQDFIPAPFDIATCMYYTGIDPFTKKKSTSPATCATARCSAPCSSSSSRRTISRCARPWWRRAAGSDRHRLRLPDRSPTAEEASQARIDRANDYVHAMPGQKRGYRPGRKCKNGSRSRAAREIQVKSPSERGEFGER